MNKFFTALVVSFCLVLGFFLPVFSAEQLTITTYYPSPYGSYRQLTADQIAIGSGYRNLAYADGNLYVQNQVGIGTTSPSATLDVNGQIRIRGGSPAAGMVLTSDVNGIATWEPATVTCSCPGSNLSQDSGSSACWTSYSGGNSNYPHCGQICTPAGWTNMAPCGDGYY